MYISQLCVGGLGNIMILLTHALHCLYITFPVKYASELFSFIKHQEKFKPYYKSNNS